MDGSLGCLPPAPRPAAFSAFHPIASAQSNTYAARFQQQQLAQRAAAAAAAATAAALNPTANVPAPAPFHSVASFGNLAGGGDSEGEAECAVCMDAIPEVTLQPCGHTVLCRACCARVMAHAKEEPPACPLCREEIKAVE